MLSVFGAGISIVFRLSGAGRASTTVFSPASLRQTLGSASPALRVIAAGCCSMLRPCFPHTSRNFAVASLVAWLSVLHTRCVTVVFGVARHILPVPAACLLASCAAAFASSFDALPSAFIIPSNNFAATFAASLLNDIFTPLRASFV